MDFFSHGLWTFIASRILKRKTLNKVDSIFIVFWGVFPDLLAFVIPYLWLFWNFIAGRISFNTLPRPDKIEPISPEVVPASELVSVLYSLGHSLIIFLMIFFALSVLILLNRYFNIISGFRQIPWLLGGWLLHILMDIPTHAYGFYSTPAFWPLSNWKFDGLYWGTPWFLMLNYILIIAVFYHMFGLEKIKIFTNWPYWKNILIRSKPDID